MKNKFKSRTNIESSVPSAGQLSKLAFSSFLLLSIFSIAVFCSGCTPGKSEYSSGSSFAGMSKDLDKVMIVYPMSNPSITEGRELWDKMNCASCHGDHGQGVAGKSDTDLSDEFFMYRRTPIKMYRELYFDLPKKGHVKIDAPPQKVWGLVFFIRSLSCPPFSNETLAEMEPFFSANCAACHGMKGFGDGEKAKGLNPRPANFHQYNRLYDRQDFMLFNHIGDGLFPAAMPPWRGFKDPQLKVEVDNRYIKKLVEYVRHFAVDTGDKPLFYWDEAKNGKAPILDEADLEECCPQPDGTKKKRRKGPVGGAKNIQAELETEAEQ